MDFLTQQERNLMASDIIDLTTDPQMRGTVLYKSYSGVARFSPISGSISATYAGTWISVIRVPIDEREIEVTGGAGVPDSRYQLGDYSYLVPVSVLGIVKKDDRIVDGGIERYVYEYKTDAINIFQSILVRNLGNR